MKVTVVALAGLMVLGTPIAHAEKAIAPIVIDDDDGGEVDTYIAWYQRVKESHVPVVLRGICQSACGLVLMLPRDQVCVEPTASLGFHLVSANRLPLPDYTAAMFRRYTPPAVQDWVASKELTPIMIFMTAKEIVDLGVFPACSTDPKE